VSEDLHKLQLHKEIKKLFVGIGNVLKRDDGVGVYISQRIRKSDFINNLTVEVGIENYIGKINSLNPELLILIDCMYLGLSPGSFRIINIDRLHDQTYNTHNISLNRLGDFFNMPVWVLGIQPLDISFGEALSQPVKEAADKILEIINNERHG
jgi:hydrogenase 3 maturation protease